MMEEGNHIGPIIMEPDFSSKGGGGALLKTGLVDCLLFKCFFSPQHQNESA